VFIFWKAFLTQSSFFVLYRPAIFDPSELRTDVTGKVVRYLQDNGGDVVVGQAYVEVEAMKMIMPIKASESGKITHNRSPGSVIAAGDLMATLELKDPSKVKKIVSFDGTLDTAGEELDIDPKEGVYNILAGFSGKPEAVAQAACAAISDKEEASAFVTDTINEYVRVEKMFAGKLKDDVVREMAKANPGNLHVVIADNEAHMALPLRNRLILAMIREVEIFGDRFRSADISADLEAALEELAGLKQKVYGELSIAADSLLRKAKVPAFEDRVAELKATLLNPETDLVFLSKSTTLSAGVDLLTSLFADEDKAVKEAAVEVYIRRVYRAHRISNLSIGEMNGNLVCDFTFQFSDVEPAQSVDRQGHLCVLSSLSGLSDDIPKILDNFAEKIGEKPTTAADPVNMLHIAVASSEPSDLSGIEATIKAQERKMSMMGVRTVNILVPEVRADPLYYTFPQCDGYAEDPLRRNMRPTFHHLLELSRLRDNFNLERIPAVGKNAQVYVGTEKAARPGRGGPQQVVFLRAISHSPGIVSSTGALKFLQQGLDELERTQANSKVSLQSSSRIFLHSLRELEDISPMQVAKDFQKIISELKSQLADRLLKLRVDEIEVRVRLLSKSDSSGPVTKSLRIVASSVEGEWLKPCVYVERPDPVTGVAAEYCIVDPEGGVGDFCVIDPYGGSNVVQTKRAIARRVGSTYAYDFLGLLEVGLISEWQKYFGDNEKTDDIPVNLFESQEFLEGADGELVLGPRPIGTNKIGMLAWLLNMKTPEYPEGREVVLIANDVTVQSGSFGVEEDDFFYKASKYAREHKLPRVYISCNAGARIGLVDELKGKINIKFLDAENPSKGFDYLYLSDEDYKALPAGTVIANKVSEGWAISDVIGTKHGIGVENLQGSGKIAGETSAAYDEIFTLSYVTGRSVGIGAYLVRLGQRVIQMQQGPIILTGYSALNKLLGRDVYNSQDQLGGPQIMHPNGVAHEIVNDDQAGVASLIKWLGFVSKTVGALPAVRESADPVDRKVEWRPTPTPYDPRLMMAGEADTLGFFDKGSFTEYLAGWGKSVVVGRGRLGGISMGAIAVETRLVEQIIPADPADAKSREAVLPQAGQVLFPDSSYKTAQAINDFKREGLPIMIFANWRGFSGGSRDMAGEILKFGAMIVDALREYEHPVYMYIPPHGELRGGSWVVVDPTINPEKMEMYADPDSRGGILEPAGIIEVKFRESDQLKLMHRIDPQLNLLDTELEMCEFDEDAKGDILEQIKSREDSLKPVYLQAATEFADLHDKTGRMKAKGVIKEAVAWENSREFFYYRAKRRMIEDSYVGQLKSAHKTMTRDGAIKALQSSFSGDWEDNKAVLAFYEAEADTISAKISSVKADGIKGEMEALQKQLDGL
jgi:acetyl-CoA carboxylase/biotin carboxylase 1